MLTAAIAGACCLAVGAVLMTSAARRAAVTVPVSVGPDGMLVFNPATGTAHQGDTVKWTWGTKVTVRWASSESAAGFVEDVQQRKPGAAKFTALVTGSTASRR
jgi:plastocyanin